MLAGFCSYGITYLQNVSDVEGVHSGRRYTSVEEALMADLALFPLFFAFVVGVVAYRKQRSLGPKPEVRGSSKWLAYTRAQAQILPFWLVCGVGVGLALAWVLFCLMIGRF